MKRAAVLLSVLFFCAAQARASMKAEEVREALKIVNNECSGLKFCEARYLDEALLSIGDYRSLSETVQLLSQDMKKVSDDELKSAELLCDQLLKQLADRTLFRGKRKLFRKVMNLLEDELLEKSEDESSKYFARRNYAAQEVILGALLNRANDNLKNFRTVLDLVKITRTF